jgi:hypothetical protein
VTCTAPGTHTATLTADDGNDPAVSDTTTVTITVPGADTTPPHCKVLRGSWPNVQLRLRDTGVVIATVTATGQENVTVQIPTFTEGTTDDVVVEATQVVPDTQSIAEFTITDVDGNTLVCRAVFVNGFVCQQILYRPRTTQWAGSFWEKGNFTIGCYPIPD